MKLLDSTAVFSLPITQRESHLMLGSICLKLVAMAIAFALLALTPFCLAQSRSASFDAARELARGEMPADRRAIIEDAMDFTPKEAAEFWPIYRRYEYERLKLADLRDALIEYYSENYLTISDEDAKKLAEEVLKCDSGLVDLNKKYFKKFNKVLSAYTVAKFFQVEHRIELATDVKLQPALPPLNWQPEVAQQR
jgi:hypothetical protein